MTTSTETTTVFDIPYASRAGALRAAKRAGFDIADLIINVREDGKHQLAASCSLPNKDATSTISINDTTHAPVTLPIKEAPKASPVTKGKGKDVRDAAKAVVEAVVAKAPTKKDLVMSAMRAKGGTTVADIASDLRISTTAAASLIGDVRRAGLKFTVERKDGRAIYSA